MIKITYTPEEIKAYYKGVAREKLKIGFVPTMGSLHEGHASLIRRSKQENDLTVCSIFVNPTQFNQPDDFDKYPRNTNDDLSILTDEGCDMVFLPETETMYATANPIKLNFGQLETVLEGKFRPGHFNGVGLIVAKFLNMVDPDKVYFGQKDLQQVAVIRMLTNGLSFPVQVITCPVIREESGLAHSSRNARLSDNGRQKALIFHQSLKKAEKMLYDGESMQTILSHINDDFDTSDASLEYLNLVNANSFDIYQSYDETKNQALCIAGQVEDVRLIDNIILV